MRYITVGLVLLAVALPSGAANLVMNGSFEDPSVSAVGIWGNVGDVIGSGWVLGGSDWDEGGQPDMYIYNNTSMPWGNIAAANGNQHVQFPLGNHNTVELSQNIATIPGATYKLAFAAKMHPDYVSSGNGKIKLTFGSLDEIISLPLSTWADAPNPASWTRYERTIVASGSSTKLTFTRWAQAVWLDDVSVTMVSSVPSETNYQGKLTDPSGSPLADGSYQLVFSLFSTETAGTALWTSAVVPVTTTSGVFTTLLNIPDDVLNQGTLWLQTTVGGEALVPRVKFCSVPYAVKAKTAETALQALVASEATGVSSVGATPLVIRVNGNPAMQLNPDGSVKVFSSPDGSTGVSLGAGASYWDYLSDSSAKQNISKIDPQDILNKLMTVPVKSWSYKSQGDNIRHIGPMAQDFYAAFGMGTDERHISPMDPDGVALAAIQALHQEIINLRNQNDQLKSRLIDLERKLEVTNQAQ